MGTGALEKGPTGLSAPQVCTPDTRAPEGVPTHLRHLLKVEVQGEAGAVVVQVAGAWHAGGAGWQGLLSPTLTPGRTGWLQTLARSPVQAPLARWALGTQGVRRAYQQAGLLPTPHLGVHTQAARSAERPGPAFRSQRAEGRGQAHLAAISAAIQAAATVAVLQPGAAVREGRTP